MYVYLVSAGGIAKNRSICIISPLYINTSTKWRMVEPLVSLKYDMVSTIMSFQGIRGKDTLCFLIYKYELDR